METLRLLIDEPLDGPTNMARDEALLALVASGAAPPTLRLYRWQPACLSLGRFQPASVARVAACADRGVQIVRRPSGGRALLHADELTYALALDGRSAPGQGTIADSYRRISEALLAGLRALGVRAELEPRRPTGDQRPTADHREPSLAGHGRRSVVGGRSAACYDAATAYELTVGGRKLVGSAQTRRDGALLQHGAVPFSPHAELLAELLASPAPALDQRMATLGEALGRAPAFEAVAEALTAGFARAWGVDLLPGARTAEELALAEALRRDKYTSDSWTFAR